MKKSLSSSAWLVLFISIVLICSTVSIVGSTGGEAVDQHSRKRIL